MVFFSVPGYWLGLVLIGIGRKWYTVPLVPVSILLIVSKVFPAFGAFVPYCLTVSAVPRA